MRRRDRRGAQDDREGRARMIAMHGAPDEASVEAHIWSRLATTDEANEPAVSLRGLTKTFGSLRAVDDFNLEIRGGEAVALLGPNGAGKSTTTSMLLRLLTADSASARRLGTPAAAGGQGGRLG